MISALEVKTMSILYSVETELANIEQNIVENAKQGNIKQKYFIGRLKKF
jgi:hypothetical protein